MSTSAAPAVSVVIPSYQRPEGLDACLRALARLRPPEGGFEVVIVDDGSTPPLAPVVERHRSALDVVLHRQGNAGPARARNAGAARARGALLAFTDDDCGPEPGWLVALVDAARRHPGALLGGRTRNGVDGDRCAEASQLLVEHVCGQEWSQPSFFPSNNIAVPADGYRDIGGFDEEFPLPAGEDRDLCERWASSGRPLVRAPEAVIVHHHGFTIRSFWRQHHNYGRGAYRFHRRRADRGAGGVWPETPRFYVDLVTKPVRESHEDRAALAGLLVVSQVANALGFVTEAVAARRERSD